MSARLSYSNHYQLCQLGFPSCLETDPPPGQSSPCQHASGMTDGSGDRRRVIFCDTVSVTPVFRDVHRQPMCPTEYDIDLGLTIADTCGRSFKRLSLIRCIGIPSLYQGVTESIKLEGLWDIS